MLIFLVLGIVLFTHIAEAVEINCSVVVIGGSSSGVAAAIQSARLGVKTCLIEETNWLGGMMAAAGITAFDGPMQNTGRPPYNNIACNEKFCFSSGIFRETEKKIHEYYCGQGVYPCTGLSKGSVSVSAFEANVSRKVINTLVDDEPNLKYNIYYNMNLTAVLKNATGNRVIGVNATNSTNATFTFYANITIDATELGDVIALANVTSRVGRESCVETGEPHALGGVQNKECGGAASCMASCPADNKTQAFTFVIVIKNFNATGTLINNISMSQPPEYNASKYQTPEGNWTGYIAYGYTPDSNFSGEQRFNFTKQFTNFPNYGNDFAFHNQTFSQCSGKASIVEMNKTERECLLAKARNHALGFLYFLKYNSSSNYKANASTWGSYNAFNGTENNLSIIPYYRESRRIIGLKTLYEQNISNFTFPGNTTGRGVVFNDSIAIGDFYMDMHAVKVNTTKNNSYNNESLGEMIIGTYPFQIPYGVLVPAEMDGLLAAEKSISVSHIANGATRVQPTAMMIGQAAGAAAALSVKKGVQPRNLNVRDLQRILLRNNTNKENTILIFFSDVPGNYWSFPEIQLIGLEQITLGTTAFPTYTYSPTANVTRLQMAIFLCRALHLNVTKYNSTNAVVNWTDLLPNDTFTGPYWSYTQAIYENNITTGCVLNSTGRYFCPYGNTTRLQMAIFIGRALHLTNTNLSKYNSTNMIVNWTDFPPSNQNEGLFWNYTQALFEMNITRGCNVTNLTATPPKYQYCWDSVMSRDQMAAFLARTFLGEDKYVTPTSTERRYVIAGDANYTMY